MCHIEMYAKAIENHSGNPLHSVSLNNPSNIPSLRCKIVVDSQNNENRWVE
jgi:hypothetical protein